MTTQHNFDLVLKNANITTFSEKHNKVITECQDIGIKDGLIAEIGTLKSSSTDQLIDVSHLVVLPGIIDSQVHFREPGLTHKEDLESGSRAAILGGVTTFFEMPNTSPPTANEDSFNAKITKASTHSYANYAFFIGSTPQNLSQLSTLESLEGCSGIKTFLGSSYGDLLIDQDEWVEQIFLNTKKRLIFHCEDESRLKERKSLALKSQNVIDHDKWRDEDSALIATQKILNLAKKYQHPVHVLHVSSSEEMAVLKKFKYENTNLCSVEILPQFLLLSAPECYDLYGTLAQQNPPIRNKRHLEHLWAAVQNGTVDIIGSDHAPHTFEEKMKPYPQSPSGMPGVQTLAPLMLDQVNQKKLSIEKFVELTTYNPARIFKLHNRGIIAKGYAADFSIFDLKTQKIIEQKWLASKSNWSPFVNKKITAWPIMTLVNGSIAMRDDQVNEHRFGQKCLFNS